MCRQISIMFFFMIILLLASCINPGEMVDIGSNLKRGDIFNGEIEIDQVLIQEITNQKFETTQYSTSTMRFTVKEKRNSNLKIDALYEDIIVNLKNPLINIKYDSKSKNNADELESIKNIINKKLTILINNKGEILSIDGINQILNSIIRNNTTNPLATATIITFFNEKQLKNTLTHLFNYFPRKKVRTGDIWSNSQPLVIDNFKLKTNNKWKLEKINADMVFLILNAKITGNYVSGTQEGNLEVDRDTGWISSGNIVQNIPINNEQGSIGLKSTITFAFKKVK